MKHLRLLAEVLLQWGNHEPRVDAILWCGSTARGDSGPTSDLDTVVLHVDGCASLDVFRSLLAHLGNRPSFSTFVPGSGEATVWVDPQLTKIDLHFGSDPEDFAWLADCPDVPIPRLVVGYDPGNRCARIVERATTELSRSVPDLLNAEIEKFLCGFEAASSAHRRSDGYQFYFHYNLALHRLARIVELLRGDPVYMFLPKLLLPKRMPLEEQKIWRELRGSIYLPEANGLKRRLAERFLEAIDDAHSNHKIDRRRDEAEAFLRAVLQRDLFFNVRDFADAFEGKVRPGVLFRASTLTRWGDEPALAEWLRENRVRRIIDLRKADEMETATGHYPGGLLADIKYFHAPMGGPPLHPDLPPSSPETGDAYIQMFKAERSAIVEAIKAIVGCESGATVIHCHAGKDRTGIVCAVVALLLDLPRTDVVADYMLSGQGVTEQAIERFLAWFEQAAARQSLCSDGVDEALISRLRLRLVNLLQPDDTRATPPAESPPQPSTDPAPRTPRR